jgi:hypothetical protein
MYAATHDGGNIDRAKFDDKQLTQMKSTCERHCFSTLNHNLSYCYDHSPRNQVDVEIHQKWFLRRHVMQL